MNMKNIVFELDEACVNCEDGLVPRLPFLQGNA